MQQKESALEKRSQVRLDRELVNVLEVIAKQERRSRSFVARDLIKEALAQRGVNV